MRHGFARGAEAAVERRFAVLVVVSPRTPGFPARVRWSSAPRTCTASSAAASACVRGGSRHLCLRTDGDFVAACVLRILFILCMWVSRENSSLFHPGASRRVVDACGPASRFGVRHRDGLGGRDPPPVFVLAHHRADVSVQHAVTRAALPCAATVRTTTDRGWHRVSKVFYS